MFREERYHFHTGYNVHSPWREEHIKLMNFQDVLKTTLFYYYYFKISAAQVNLRQTGIL